MRKYLTLAEAAQLLPRPPVSATLWRWCVKGFYIRYVDKIIRLRHVRIGRKMFTTEEWLEQFVDDLSAAREAERKCRTSRPGRKVDRILQLYEADGILRQAGF